MDKSPKRCWRQKAALRMVCTFLNTKFLNVKFKNVWNNAIGLNYMKWPFCRLKKPNISIFIKFNWIFVDTSVVMMDLEFRVAFSPWGAMVRRVECGNEQGTWGRFSFNCHILFLQKIFEENMANVTCTKAVCWVHGYTVNRVPIHCSWKYLIF